MARAIQGTIFKRGTVFWCKFKHQGRDFRFSLQTSKDGHAQHEADRQMTLRRAAIMDGSFNKKFGRNDDPGTCPNGKVPIASVWKCYVASVTRPDSGPTTLRQYECQVSQFVEWLRTQHPKICYLSEIDKRIAKEFAVSLRSRAAAGTFNKYVSLLQLVFKVLSDEAGNSENPWNGIARMKGMANSRRVFTDEELGLIFQKAEGEILTLCLLAYHTAFRLGDACGLEWREVDLARRRISRVPLKTARRTGRQVIVPIHNELFTHLDCLRGKAATPYVCPQMADLYRRASAAVTAKFQQFFKDCGIRLHKEGTGNDTGKRAVVEVGFHSFRHTWVTRAAENGMDSASIRTVVGWGSPAMEKIYTHVSPEHLEKVMGSQPSIGAGSLPAGGASVRTMTDVELRRLLDEAKSELTRRGEQASQDDLATQFPEPLAIPA